MKEQRLEWIDSAKATIMVMVILGHMPVNKTELTWIYSFHMPFFFIVSGMTYCLAESRKKRSIWNYVLYRAKGLLLPYFTLNLMMMPVWYVNYKILSHSKRRVWHVALGIFVSNQDVQAGPTNATWFLTALFLITVAFFLLERLFRFHMKRTLTTAFLIGAAGFAFSKLGPQRLHLPWHLNVVPVGLFFFAAGVAFMQNRGRIMAAIGRLRWLFILAGLIVGSAAGLYNGKISTHGNVYNNIGLFLASSLLLSGAVILFWIDRPSIKLFDFLGKNTLVVLAVHCPMLRTLENYSKATREFAESFPNLTGILILFLSLAVAWVIERYFPFILGKKRRKQSL